jgi:hypothetical protein
VFVDVLYPSITETPLGKEGRIPLELYVYGPGMNGQCNLTRKILKGPSYKNWRLNGEYVENPDDNPERFNALVPTDFVIFSFDGELYPTSASAVFVAQTVRDDAMLHAQLDVFLGMRRMAALAGSDLAGIVARAQIPEAHPVNALLLDAALEDAALGGSKGIRRLSTRPSGRRVSRHDLRRARQRAEEIGNLGEEYVNNFLSRLTEDRSIEAFEWASLENAVSPYDFVRIQLGGERRLLDVKATSGEFTRPIHISFNELLQMKAGPERYDLYRIYDMGEETAKLRIAEGLEGFASRILDVIGALPSEITIDGISVPPSILNFESEMEIQLVPEPDEID